MAYIDLANLAADQDFRTRNAACAAEQGLTGEHPLTWADRHAWTLAATPGFADAYASALAGNVERPGLDPAVISDAQILAAVQPMFRISTSENQ